LYEIYGFLTKVFWKSIKKLKCMKKVFYLWFFGILMQNLSGQGKFTDPRDGNVYKTIKINNYTWMIENLKYKAPEGAYYFDNDSNNNKVYGLLYEWKIAMKVCPNGWHLPSGVEFQALVDHFNQKETWKSKASDSTSFGIQLAGMQDFEGNFTEMGESEYFWTSTEYDKDNAEYFSYMVVVNTPVVDISRKDDIADIHGAEKTNKYSVRCVKN
jgi:uncharacterized protein (TIGR02145 family)